MDDSITLKHHNTLKGPLDENGLLSMDKITQHIKSLISEKSYGLAINYLNNIKNNPALDKHLDIIKLHDLYIEVLLIIEDFKSLENILKSKEKYINNKKDKNIHQFYLAICYEGLGKTNLAIDALESIEDQLSNKNLTNKYLKLSLLYIQTKNINMALKAYEHAQIFDRQKESDIFLLVQSDLAYFKKNYIDSMKFFEDFFIKTHRKFAYLNRFIRISLALNRQNDAFEFYKRYKEKIINQESIQVKISFFQAILDLLKELDQNEYIEVNNYLSIINNRQTINFDDFDYFQVVLKHLKQHKIYQKEREIIRDIFIDLNQTKIFRKLLFLKVVDGEIHIQHLSKKLLLEKQVNNDHFIFDQIITGQFQHTYKREMLNDFIFMEDQVDYVFVEDLGNSQFILTYLNEADYDLGKKLTILSKHLLIDKLNDYYLRNKQSNQFIAINKLLDKTDYGLIKIVNNQVYLLNERSNKILNLSETVIDYKSFQESFESIIYLDEFYHKERHLCKYLGQDILMQSLWLDNELYILLSIYQDKEETRHLYTLQENKKNSLLLIDIYNYQALQKNHSPKKYNQFINDFKKKVNLFSNHHAIEIFIEAKHLFFVLLDNLDKRIPERLIQKLNHEYKGIFDIRAVYHPFNSPIDQIINKLYEMMQKTSTDKPLIFNYKQVKLDLEKRQLYLESLQGLISHKEIPLNFHFIRDWHDHKLHYIDVSLGHLNILTDESLKQSVLRNHQLTIQFDRLVVNQLIKQVKQLSFKSKWIIPINNETIQSKKAFNYILRRLLIIKDHEVIFKLNTNDYLNLSIEDKNYLQEKTRLICLDGFVSIIDDVNNLNENHLLMINKKVINQRINHSLLDYIGSLVEEVIYDHEDNNLIKKEIQDLNIRLIKGEFSGSTQDFSNQ